MCHGRSRGDHRGAAPPPLGREESDRRAGLPSARRTPGLFGRSYRVSASWSARRIVWQNHWHHMYNGVIISMPDKWEYPWYADWDLAFHVPALTLVDPDFGKRQ